MAKKTIREIVSLIKDFLEKRNIKVNKIIIFGSCIKSNYKKDSDVDVAIISSDFEGKDTFQRVEMLKGLEWALVERFILPFDIVLLSLKEFRESSSIMVDFIKEGASF